MNPLSFDYSAPSFQRLALLLAKIGRSYSEVGLTDPDQIQQQLIFRSLLVEPLLVPEKPLIDIGSGVGIPALPLALASPERKIIIVEPRQRCHSFCRWLLSKMPDLKVELKKNRLEEFNFANFPGSQVVSRASFPFSKLSRFVPPGIEPVIKWSPAKTKIKSIPENRINVRINVSTNELEQNFLWAARPELFHVKQNEWKNQAEINFEVLNQSS